MAGAALVGWGGLAVAGPPQAPPVSSFAPAEDLVGQVDFYLERLAESVETAAEYADSDTKVAKDANTMILIALALGLHDKENRYKAAAPAILKASQQLAAATDYASARAGVAALKAAMTSTDGDRSVLKWTVTASLPETMEQVPLINSRLKRYLRGSRFKSQAGDTAGQSAVMAAIAQGSMANAGDTVKPEEAAKWYAFCQQMREASTALNAAIHAQDEAAKDAAIGALAKSCDDCHAVFHEEE
jgi:hypothetical protein